MMQSGKDKTGGFENTGNICFPKWDNRFLSVYYFKIMLTY